MNRTLLIIIFLTAIIGGGIFFMIQNTSPVATTAPTTQDEGKKRIIIAAFGDSLTAGYGVELENSYPAILEKQLKEQGVDATVINMGVSGETTQGGRERTGFVLDQKPDIVLLGLGGNDMLRTLPVKLTQDNLIFIIEELQKNQEKKPGIILLGMQSSITNGFAYTREFNAMYPSLAKKYSLPLVPFFLEGVALTQELNTADGIHPNKEGYIRIVNENIMPILLPYIKKNFK